MKTPDNNPINPARPYTPEEQNALARQLRLHNWWNIQKIEAQVDAIVGPQNSEGDK